MPRQSTVSSGPSKPVKPYVGFPLFSHPSGQWAKKIRKRLVYFGSWRSDPEGIAALQVFNREWPYLKEGRTPPLVDVSEGCSLRKLANEFLRSKEEKLNAGELSPRTFRDYYKTCERLISQFGKERRVDDLRPEDFRAFRGKLAERWGVVSLKNEINRCCIVFNYAFDNNLIDKPVSYGSNFDRPSARALRRSRNEAGPKIFTRDECLRILNALEGKSVTVTGVAKPLQPKADPAMRAMVLLGLNCGFGNTDVASLPQSAVDLDSGWIEFPRPKTEIHRRIPLWQETREALAAAIEKRPKVADPASDHLCFLTRQGRPWVRVKPKRKEESDESIENVGPDVTVPIDSLSQQFGKLLHQLKINGRRGLGFYTLRHVFETQAGESKDQVAVDSVMGHVDSSMAANYRHGISDERLRAAVGTVHAWLFGTEGVQ